MAEPGLRPPSIPVPYRLALALSLAVLVHTLLLAGLPSPVEEAREVSHRLAFTLSTPASQPAASATSAERADDAREPRHQEFSVDPHLSEITTLNPASRTTASPEVERPAAPIARNQLPMPAVTASKNTPPTQAYADSAETSALPAEPANEPALTQQITHTPSEHDPYLVILARHLAETLEQQPVPAISQLSETVTMELALRILPNGALTSARVVKSTRVPGIDEAAYRAALTASPYPEPEGESSDRFEVTLVFAPKRY